METARAEDASSHPFSGLYKFVRDHLVIVNAVVVASGTFVGAMDFLAPRLSVLPAMVYTATGILTALLITAALAPALVARLFELLGFTARSDGKRPLWRRPGWQFGVAILGGVTALGFTSVTKAAEGGYFASKFLEAKRWQISLLSLEADTREIKSGVAAANGKLDRIVDVVDPDNPADRCPDIACAIQSGASAKAVKILFAKGARIEGGPVNRGELSKEIAESRRGDRLQVLDLLIEHGLDPEAIFFAFANSQDELNAEAVRIARDADRVARIGDRFVSKYSQPSTPEMTVWSEINGCLLRTSRGTSMMELAAIRGDLELYRHLKARGVSLPGRPLDCKWTWLNESGGARIDIHEGVASVSPLPL